MRSIVKYLFMLAAVILPVTLMAQQAGKGAFSTVPDGPVTCEAGFTYEQDLTDPLICNFYDQSVGDISDYFWDFGDGSTATGQVLSHAFPVVGTYNVCLTISNNDTADFCSDSICMTINLDPESYHLLGGLLYAGDFPINNPNGNGDMGFAYLYRVLESGICPVDTVYFDTLGYYYFVDVPSGDYLIKSGLKTNSNHYLKYLPAYYGGTTQWNEADTIHLSANIFLADIHMRSLPVLATGNNVIKGYVIADDKPGLTGRTGDCEVILCDSTGKPLRYSYTNPSGSFRFNQIPEGKYLVKAEQTGMYTDVVPITLDAINPANDSVEIQLHYTPQSLETLLTGDSLKLTLYPNPVTSQLNMAFSSAMSLDIQYTLVNTLGEWVFSRRAKLPAGNSYESVDVSACSPGLYFLICKEMNTGRKISSVVVIQ